MDPRTWLVFALTELLLSLTPGPAVLLVVSQSLRFGSRQSRHGAFGILAANACYFSLSAAGLGALLFTSSTLFACVKWMGAAYLCVVGVRMVIRRRASTAAASADRERHFFAQGLVTQLSNPKALVYFTALLPQFVSRGQSVLLQFAILGVSSIAIGARGARDLWLGRRTGATARVAGEAAVGG